jgi:hypothetical protein
MNLFIAYLLGLLSALVPRDRSNRGVNPTGRTGEEKSPMLPQRCHHKMPLWKIVLEILSVIGILAGAGAAGYYAWVNKKMWQEMRTQTTTAQTQLELSERPWIKIVDAAPTGEYSNMGGLSFLKAGPYKDAPDVQVQVNLNLKISFKNIGHSVADVAPKPELVIPKFSTSGYWDAISAEERKFCGSPDTQAVTFPKITLFPDEPEPFEWNGTVSNLIRADNMNDSPIGVGVTPALIVCISYRQKGLPNLYQTRAVYEITRHQGGNRFFNPGPCNIKPVPNFPMTFCDGGVIASLLKFDRDTMGDDAY